MFWTSLSQCTGLGQQRRSEPPWLCSSPSISKVISNAVNNYFVSSVNSIALSCAQPILHDSNVFNPTYEHFALHHAKSDDVSKAINALSSSATSSIGKISLKLLRLSLPVIASPLSHIFNMSIDTDYFPFVMENWTDYSGL